MIVLPKTSAELEAFKNGIFSINQGSGFNIAKAIGQVINDISGVTQQQDYNSAEAQKQRDFEERMSNTTYQRTLKDISDSGLNAAAVLSSGGSLDSAPTGSSASSNVASSNFLPNLVFSASSLMNSVNNKHELQNRQAVRNVNTILKVISTAAKLAVK